MAEFKWDDLQERFSIKMELAALSKRDKFLLLHKILRELYNQSMKDGLDDITDQIDAVTQYAGDTWWSGK